MKLVQKGKAVPLQAWSGPEGSRKLMFSGFLTTEQDGGKRLKVKGCFIGPFFGTAAL
jgi:hypothetical protein